MRFTSTKSGKKIKFLGEEVEIFKLSVGQVIAVQKLVKDNEAKEDTDGLSVLMFVIKEGCPEFKDYSDDEIQGLPMDELSKLSSEIMKHSGLVK